MGDLRAHRMHLEIWLCGHHDTHGCPPHPQPTLGCPTPMRSPTHPDWCTSHYLSGGLQLCGRFSFWTLSSLYTCPPSRHPPFRHCITPYSPTALVTTSLSTTWNATVMSHFVGLAPHCCRTAINIVQPAFWRSTCRLSPLILKQPCLSIARVLTSLMTPCMTLSPAPMTCMHGTMMVIFFGHFFSLITGYIVFITIYFNGSLA